MPKTQRLKAPWRPFTNGLFSSPEIGPLSIAFDVALCLFLSAPFVGSPLGTPIGSSLGESGLAANVTPPLFALVLLVARRRWPIQALICALLVSLVVTTTLGRITVLIPITIVLLFVVAIMNERRVAIQAAVLVVLTMVTCIAVLGVNSFFGPGLLAGLAWPALAAGAGNAIRVHREAISVAEDRAAQAEATREDEARRRVVEERLHIARELHDVIAHKIAVINVQAGVATHLLRTKPDEAATCLATVRSSAREVLDELAGLLGVLRTVDEEESDGQGSRREPTPTLHDVATLVDSFQRVGLHVTFESTGKPERVTNVAEIAAYRAIQEALTNAHKHGNGYATLRVAHEKDSLHIVITNQLTPGQLTPGQKVASVGYGLIGMQERVRSAGGTVTATEQPDNTFVVSVVLPHMKPELAT
jgi:signal transduction histidine kinase